MKSNGKLDNDDDYNNYKLLIYNYLMVGTYMEEDHITWRTILYIYIYILHIYMYLYPLFSCHSSVATAAAWSQHENSCSSCDNLLYPWQFQWRSLKSSDVKFWSWTVSISLGKLFLLIVPKSLWWMTALTDVPSSWTLNCHLLLHCTGVQIHRFQLCLYWTWQQSPSSLPSLLSMLTSSSFAPGALCIPASNQTSSSLCQSWKLESVLLACFSILSHSKMQD